jgi:uncharacterized oligopeptide transporter (OPT) family protein
MEEKREAQRLPANAYKPLGPGETYRPYVPASSMIPEITVRSVGIGILMAGTFARRSTISENVIIQSIGSASGVVVAGMIFTLPALFILELPLPCRA